MLGKKKKGLGRAEQEQIYKMYDGHCAYCGSKISRREMHIDHVRPLSKGGADTLENMRPACRSCSHYKSMLGQEEFRSYLAGLPRRLMQESTPYRVATRFGIVEHVTDEVVFYFEKAAGGTDH